MVVFSSVSSLGFLIEPTHPFLTSSFFKGPSLDYFFIRFKTGFKSNQFLLLSATCCVNEKWKWDAVDRPDVLLIRIIRLVFVMVSVCMFVWLKFCLVSFTFRFFCSMINLNLVTNSNVARFTIATRTHIHPHVFWKCFFICVFTMHSSH